MSKSTPRVCWTLTLVGAVASSAHAQPNPDPDEIMSMYVKMIDSGNANGILEPGETLRITAGASFNPGIGEPMIWQSNTPLGNYPGTVKAFGSSLFGLYGGADAETGQLDFVGMAPLDWIGAYQYTKGSIWNIHLIQYNNQPIITFDNPIDLMWWDWIPDDYTPRTVDWYVDAPGFGFNTILLDTVLPNGQPVVVGDDWLTQISPIVGIQIVPAPVTMPVVALCTLVAGRRRRRM